MVNLFLKFCYSFVISFSLSLPLMSAFAQTTKTGTSGLVTSITNYNQSVKGELVFLHLDKPYYTQGDTLWFKVYLLESSSQLPSSQSGLVYIELVNADNVVAKRLVLPAVSGVSWGDIKLDEDLSAGFYLVRGYTNWMRNFDSEYLFTKRIEVVDNTLPPWLIDEASSITGNKLELTLKLTATDNSSVLDEKLDIKLNNNDKTFHRKEYTSPDQGVVRVNFDLPDKINDDKLLVNINSLSDKDKTTSFPVALNRLKHADVQFLPEGGHLVNNISSLVGFKAIGEDENGIDVAGRIIDQHLNEILSFKSLHRGMGSFTIVPAIDAVYSAEIIFSDGSKRIFRLPEVKKSGTVLHVASTMQNDSLDIQVTLSPDMLNGAQRFHLIGQSRDVVVCAATITGRRSVFKTRVAKSIFHSGIAYFTLFDDNRMPLNERKVFINHEDNLKIDINTELVNYSPRDSIPLNISITDIGGDSVNGSFSVSVTDDSQVSTRLNQSEDIISYLQLTSRLKGYVEDPAYYFTDKSPEVTLALDNLLLTQGWVGYQWSNVFNNHSANTYSAESEFKIKGKVEKLFDKSAENVKVTLLSTGKDIIFKETTTDSKGNFTFSDFVGLDSMQFVLKVRSAKNRSIPASIIIEEFKPLTVPPPSLPTQQPWFVKADTTLLNYITDNKAHAKFIENEKFKDSGERLNEVVITSSRMIKGSKNLNGAGADQIITEEMIKKQGSLDLLNMIKNMVDGFHLGYHTTVFARPKTDKLYYVINGKKVMLIIDGVNVETFFSDDSTRTAHADFIKYYLTNLTAPQIKGIEIMKKSDYSMTYGRKFLKPSETIDDFVFFEITTYSGNGAFYKDAIGIAVYRPLPISLPREFYRPKFQNSNSFVGVSDRRSTIHWEPEMTVDNGRSLVSFYASDRIGTYTVIVQGIDRKGTVGYQVKKIVINPAVQDAIKPAPKGR